MILKLKRIKIIFLLGTISLITLIPYGPVEARDCSNPKGFHAKMMCKLSGSYVPADKAKKKSNGFWQKIKNFGGKNIGEAG